MTPTNGGEYIVAATKAAPPVFVSGMTLFGLPLNEIVLLLTIVYTLMQIGWFVYTKFFKRDKDNGRK